MPLDLTDDVNITDDVNTKPLPEPMFTEIYVAICCH